jgi:hypothetical protein
MKRTRLELVATSCNGLAGLMCAWWAVHLYRLGAAEISSVGIWVWAGLAAFFLVVGAGTMERWRSAWRLEAVAGCLLVLYGAALAVIGMEDLESVRHFILPVLALGSGGATVVYAATKARSVYGKAA